MFEPLRKRLPVFVEFPWDGAGMTASDLSPLDAKYEALKAVERFNPVSTSKMWAFKEVLGKKSPVTNIPDGVRREGYGVAASYMTAYRLIDIIQRTEPLPIEGALAGPEVALAVVPFEPWSKEPGQLKSDRAAFLSHLEDWPALLRKFRQIIADRPKTRLSSEQNPCKLGTSFINLSGQQKYIAFCMNLTIAALHLRAMLMGHHVNGIPDVPDGQKDIADMVSQITDEELPEWQWPVGSQFRNALQLSALISPLALLIPNRLETNSPKRDHMIEYARMAGALRPLELRRVEDVIWGILFDIATRKEATNIDVIAGLRKIYEHEYTQAASLLSLDERNPESTPLNRNYGPLTQSTSWLSNVTDVQMLLPGLERSGDTNPPFEAGDIDIDPRAKDSDGDVPMAESSSEGIDRSEPSGSAKSPEQLSIGARSSQKGPNKSLKIGRTGLTPPLVRSRATDNAEWMSGDRAPADNAPPKRRRSASGSVDGDGGDALGTGSASPSKKQTQKRRRSDMDMEGEGEEQQLFASQKVSLKGTPGDATQKEINGDEDVEMDEEQQPSTSNKASPKRILGQETDEERASAKDVAEDEGPKKMPDGETQKELNGEEDVVMAVEGQPSTSNKAWPKRMPGGEMEGERAGAEDVAEAEVPKKMPDDETQKEVNGEEDVVMAEERQPSTSNKASPKRKKRAGNKDADTDNEQLTSASKTVAPKGRPIGMALEDSHSSDEKQHRTSVSKKATQTRRRGRSTRRKAKAKNLKSPAAVGEGVDSEVSAEDSDEQGWELLTDGVWLDVRKCNLDSTERPKIPCDVDIPVYGPRLENMETFRPNVHTQDILDAVVQLADAVKRSYVDGVPLHCHSTEKHKSTFHVLSHDDFIRLPDKEVQDIFRKQNIVVYGQPHNKVDFEHALRSLGGYGGRRIEIQDQSLSACENRNTIIRTGTIRDLAAHGASPTGNVLNALDFPLGLESMAPTPYASDAHALLRTSGISIWDQKEHLPTGDFRWGLAATAGAFHGLHTDSNGFATFVRPTVGCKWWIVATPLNGDGPEKFEDLSMFLDPRFDPLGSCDGMFSFEAMLLWPDTTLYMKPNTPHAVYTPRSSVVRGGHFFATSTMRDTLAASIQTFVTNALTTNTDHTPAYTVIRRLIEFYHLALVKEEIDANDPAWAHVPDVTNIDGLMDLLCICSLGRLLSVIDGRTYASGHGGSPDKDPSWIKNDNTSLPLADRLQNQYARGLCAELLNWADQKLSLTSGGGEEEVSVADFDKALFERQVHLLQRYKDSADDANCISEPGFSASNLAIQLAAVQNKYSLLKQNKEHLDEAERMLFPSLQSINVRPKSEKHNGPTSSAVGDLRKDEFQTLLKAGMTERDVLHERFRAVKSEKIDAGIQKRKP